MQISFSLYLISSDFDEAMCGCWNANVVVNSDLGGAARHHACSHAVFVAALSISAAQCCWNANVVIDLDLGRAAWHRACSHVVLDAALSIPAAACPSQIVSVIVVNSIVSAAMLSWWGVN
ncbi:hypothetical protein Tco_1015381 [Tanacetum coccineum]|uniref:Uncharacterized protein n=1 Tax=Tanacetum coccineum TaxID=301880 RepID=A0ABQ5FKT0_9ASTR